MSQSEASQLKVNQRVLVTNPPGIHYNKVVPGKVIGKWSGPGLSTMVELDENRNVHPPVTKWDKIVHVGFLQMEIIQDKAQAIDDCE